MTNKRQISGIERLRRASIYSWKGLQAAYINEQAFRQEVFVLIPVIPLALWLGENGIERCLLICSWLLVMVVELLNSSIEASVDRVGTEQHELAGRAKDMGSAAVLIAILCAVLIWAFILFDKVSTI